MTEEEKKSHTDEIREVISKTIKELHANEAQLQFKKPKTAQGWFYVGLAFCSLVGIIWSSIVFLNDVAVHSKAPYHHGTEELIKQITHEHQTHATSDELHHSEEVLQLKIKEEVNPIKDRQQTILTNQATIQANQANFRHDVQRIQVSLDKISDQIREGGNN